MTKDIEHMVEAATADYYRVLDYCIGEAARHRCGVRIRHYPNGDLTIMPTDTVKFGTIEEVQA